MEDEKMKLERAQSVYRSLLSAMDSRGWGYKRDEENLKIECAAQGEDLPMRVVVRVNSDRQIIRVISHLPFVVSEDKRLDVAIAVSVVNNQLVDGSFDFDIATGHMFFRMTNSFIESEIGSDLFLYLLLCSFQTIDLYNDKFLMLGKGMLGIEDFISRDMES